MLLPSTSFNDAGLLLHSVKKEATILSLWCEEEARLYPNAFDSRSRWILVDPFQKPGFQELCRTIEEQTLNSLPGLKSAPASPVLPAHQHSKKVH